jgi:AcrR family transcriptional regulator
MASRANRAGRVGRPRTNPSPIDRPPRDEVIAVASRLFAEKGFAATTMREIAGRSGLQQSSIYYYFANKEEVLETIVGEANRLGLDRLARVNAEGGSAAVRLYRIVRYDAATLCVLPYDINEILRLAALQEERFAGYWKDRQLLNDEVEALVLEGTRTAELIDCDARLVALTLLSNNEATQNWYRPLGEHRLAQREDPRLGGYRPAEIGELLADMALGALLRDRRSLPRVRRRAAALDALIDAVEGRPGAAT